MRKLYNYYPNIDAMRQSLNWTNYRSIIKLKNENTRNYYIFDMLENKFLELGTGFVLVGHEYKFYVGSKTSQFVVKKRSVI